MINSILHITDKDKRLLGTSFVVDVIDNKFIVATCGHVINNKDEIFVDNFPAKVINNKYDSGIDIAILEVENLNKEPLTLAIHESEDLKVIGYTNLSTKIKKEPIDKIKPKYNTTLDGLDVIKIYTDEPINEGYSGSPVICKKTNTIIAIVMLKEGQDKNYALSSKYLIELIDKPILDTKQICNKKIIKDLQHETFVINKNRFEEELDNTLRSFSSEKEKVMWIEPCIYTEEERHVTNKENLIKLNLNELIRNPLSCIFLARQQFGLTSIAKYLVKKNWIDDSPSLWLYLDATELKPHTKEINKYIDNELKRLKLERNNIECILLDEFSSDIEKVDILLEKLSEEFSEIPIMIFMTVLDNPLEKKPLTLPNNRIFEKYYLWSLPRKEIRKVVCSYNKVEYIENDNIVLNKILNDLEVLNIPRTPFNCITMLKISEFGFDDSPVNRTEMIRRVLFLLFNLNDLPKYKTKPDLKDTEFILGYFSEILLRNNIHSFTREYFLNILNIFCKETEIDIEISVIFDILYDNNIIVMKNNNFYFKFTYWILYFAAHRMHNNSEFANYILKDMNYTAYPELIEFYTGIDRKRDDALAILINDINNTKNLVIEKCGLVKGFNIYDLIKWNASQENIQTIKNELNKNITDTNLPESVKDDYADISYNNIRPYQQNIQKILDDYSLLKLMRSVKAGAKALRNSDYASKEIRHKLLNEILESFTEIINVLVLLTPHLIKNGYATMDGASFILDGDFGNDEKEIFQNLIQTIPTNVIGWNKDDLFSNKMSTLLYNHFEKNENKLIQHLINLLVTFKQPKNWDKHLEKYMNMEEKNSFYLFDIFLALSSEYKYGFHEQKTLSLFEDLLKMFVVRHEGLNNITKEKIKKIENGARVGGKKKKFILPDREIDSY